MIETDQQRRWWFATHPEFSSRHQTQRSKHIKGEDENSGKPSPESIDAYVDARLKHEHDNVIITVLKEMKRWGGTAGQNPESYAELGLEWTGGKIRTAKSLGLERRELILSSRIPDRKITIDPNPNANSNEPFYEWHKMSQVPLFDSNIRATAHKYGMDPDLIRAIMYIETTHGWYEAPVAMAERNRTILPMNVHASYWRGLGYTREQLEDPATNVEAGARILKGIMSVLDNPSVENLATLYNQLGASAVSDYGARVKAIYNQKLWLKK